jgi:hypothetical protein
MGREYRARNGRGRFLNDMSSAIEQGQIGLDEKPNPDGSVPTQISIKRLHETMCGYELHSQLDPQRRGGYHPAQEAEGIPAMVGDFYNIIGQLMYSQTIKKFRAPEFVLSKIIPDKRTPFPAGEIIPGTTGLSDHVLVVNEAEDYPYTSPGEDRRLTPPTVKRGLIASATRETIFFDRTGMVAEDCGRVGTILGLNKEKRLWDLLLGVTNNYNWQGTAYNTYQTATPYINAIGSNTLTTYESLNAMEVLWVNMSDPNTGEPIEVSGDTTYLFVVPALWPTAEVIRSGSLLHRGVVTSAADTITSNVESPVPLRNPSFQIVSNALMSRRITAGSLLQTTWWYGQPQNAFAYHFNWDIEVTRAGSDHEANFNRDIILQVKGSERGVAAVEEPRYMLRSTVA